MKFTSATVLCLKTSLLLLPMQVFSAEQKVTQVIKSDPMSASYLMQLVLGLIVVLIFIAVLAWVAKRVNRLQSSNGSLLKILGAMSMGTREKIVLLQVGSEQLLIGVAPGRINTLHVLKSPLENTDNKTPQTGSNAFSEKLATILGAQGLDAKRADGSVTDSKTRQDKTQDDKKR